MPNSDHQDLQTYLNAAQADLSISELQKAEILSQLCLRAVSLDHPGPKTCGCGSISTWDLRYVDVDLYRGQKLTSLPHFTNRPRKKTISNLWETNGFLLPSSLSLQGSTNHTCLALTRSHIKARATSNWKSGRCGDWTTTFWFTSCTMQIRPLQCSAAYLSSSQEELKFYFSYKYQTLAFKRTIKLMESNFILQHD